MRTGIPATSNPSMLRSAEPSRAVKGYSLSPAEKTVNAVLYGMALLIGLAPMSFGFGVLGPAPFILAALVLCMLGTGQKLHLKHVPPDLFMVIAVSPILIVLGLCVSTVLARTLSIQSFAAISISYLFTLAVLPVAIVGLFSGAAESMLRGYLHGVVLLTVAAFVTYIAAFDFGKSVGWIAHNNRLQMWMHPNHFPIHVNLGLVIGAYLWIVRERRLCRMALLFVAGACCIAFSGSSGPLAIMVVSILLFGLLVSPRLLLASLAAGVVVVGVLIHLFAGRFLQTLDILARYSWLATGRLQDAGSFEMRAAAMESSLEYIAGSPFVGVGAGMGGEVLDATAENLHVVHNAFVLLWLEGGMLSILGALLWFAAVLLWAWRMRNIAGSLASLAITIVAMYWMTRTHGYQSWAIAPVAFLLAAGVRPSFVLKRAEWRPSSAAGRLCGRFI